MSEFGRLLRGFRLGCHDPDDIERRLTQEKLGELLGRELQLEGGYSGAAVSDWEHGKSRIHADQRPVLVSLIKLLHELGGLAASAQADALLEAGNYRSLTPAEKGSLFPLEPANGQSNAPAPPPAPGVKINSFPMGRRFFEFTVRFQRLLDEAEAGPPPAWPRVIAGLTQMLLDKLSVQRMLKIIIWLWVWLLTWILIVPSLHWPFTSRGMALGAIEIYVGGTFAIPLLIGILTNTAHNKFWQELKLTSSPMLRIYTYQGASVGFHLGYFLIFAIELVSYYFHQQGDIWFELTGTAVVLFLGYIAARLIPYNLWRAYGRLNFADGGVFFIFFLLGPLWGGFFYEFYSILLISIVGGITLLFALTLAVLIMSLPYLRDRTASALHGR